ncbi:MAG: response regulator [Deltaproteobacteria bacterium]|nr:response regulator [Deltaproteobacteria bacterium]
MEKKRILLVDDDPDFVEAVKAVVTNGGYDVDVAYDGKEALEKAAKQKPDLVILDVMMPVMNGHEACNALRADPATSQIPVILLTAVASRVSTSTYTHRDMLESKADDYIAKPVAPAELLARIKDWV